MSQTNEQIKALEDLRAYVVETRRSSAVTIGDKDNRIKSIIECQEAIRAIDEAIEDERENADRPARAAVVETNFY